ncbi:hypothetical protein RR48_11591 [Papilio machaon]|uniref:Uncharacterized protein n=1 Tax=Papilio machaon TaxID=76193 RepID=A0A194R518_PAPMA|nr:hypothetical protein RR48_11591 [Papilio machaon]
MKENIVMLHVSEKKFKDMCEVNPHWTCIDYGLVTPKLGLIESSVILLNGRERRAGQKSVQENLVIRSRCNPISDHNPNT